MLFRGSEITVCYCSGASLCKADAEGPFVSCVHYLNTAECAIVSCYGSCFSLGFCIRCFCHYGDKETTSWKKTELSSFHGGKEWWLVSILRGRSYHSDLLKSEQRSRGWVSLYPFCQACPCPSLAKLYLLQVSQALQRARPAGGQSSNALRTG